MKLLGFRTSIALILRQTWIDSTQRSEISNYSRYNKTSKKLKHFIPQHYTKINQAIYILTCSYPKIVSVIAYFDPLHGHQRLTRFFCLCC
jgi:hypothetical protein